MVRWAMPINQEHIEARIMEINDAVQMLRDLISKPFQELTLHEKLSMRYLIIQLIEAASSICIHILLWAFNESAEGFPECFSRLGSRGVIPRDLASKLSSAARLRNLLVHRYWAIDDERVYGSVKEGLRDFECFISCIREFLEGARGLRGAIDPSGPESRRLDLTEKDRLRLLRRLKGRLEKEGEVLFAYVYGSFLEGRPFRDLDVAIWIGDPDRAFYYTVDYSAQLEVELKVPVDVQVLNGAPLPFKHHVFTRGRLLLSRDDDLRVRLADEAMRQYMDLQMLREIARATR
jgi:uncharacterized protein YutE (UPF0331/DUF86 family)/predicted nucleotidyltransferase